MLNNSMNYIYKNNENYVKYSNTKLCLNYRIYPCDTFKISFAN